ncbi:hypothetical protein GV794_21815 [Nocardia cyriacigeorgica]|uniref:Uncharacterized protein n=1 Tax=Nocardia cyriacigeorgica TaxID=135487 RepID=A0A6P1DAB8_9NOCA|nr:hypothetical protein [Nocardia cyriacigeorgica]NEW47656.1 hypothetical protein [Nocardia cyriacigeorgica]NEW48763.1 hypothetical protein [Nocardia cyriacigeorgica]NEW58265.1 hypothetical protein [Nocardia cyriacigeorgica]
MRSGRYRRGRGGPVREPARPDDLATISPDFTHTIRRFGDWILDLSPPEQGPVTRLDLVPGAPFTGAVTCRKAVW